MPVDLAQLLLGQRYVHAHPFAQVFDADEKATPSWKSVRMTSSSGDGSGICPPPRA
jgi:hypothetical protein